MSDTGAVGQRPDGSSQEPQQVASQDVVVSPPSPALVSSMSTGTVAGVAPGGSPEEFALAQNNALLAAQAGAANVHLAPFFGRLPPGTTIDDTPLRMPPNSMPMPSLKDIALENIRVPHPNDVLCGRGGGTNNHAGNEKFRDLVTSQKVRYLRSTKRDKPYVSRGIVLAVRRQNPPGRFLQKNERTGLWYDIGDQKAREKTSQALREGAPDIRREYNTSVGVQHPMSFPQPNIGGVASPMAAAALLTAAASNPVAAFAAAAQQQSNQFDSIEMERHMRNARLAEAAMLDQNSINKGLAQQAALLEQQTGNNGNTAAVAAATSNAAAGLPPGLSRVMSGNQNAAGLVAQATPALKETESQSLLDQQQSAAAAAAAAGNGSMAQQFQQAIAAAGAAGLPLQSQLRQAGLLGDARPNRLNPSFGGDTNASARAAAVRAAAAAATGLSPAGFGALASPAAASGALPSLSFPPGVAAAGLPNPFLRATSSSGFGSPATPGPDAVVVAAARLGPSPAGPAPTTATNTNSIGQRGLGNGGPVLAGADNKITNPVVPTNPRPSVFDMQQQQQQRFGENTAATPAPPPLTEDMAFRLVFAETISQKTANGTIRADICAAEQNYNLYLDAGLLGIDPSAMAKHIAEGHSEKDIVQHYQKLAAEQLNSEEENDEEESTKKDDTADTDREKETTGEQEENKDDETGKEKSDSAEATGEKNKQQQKVESGKEEEKHDKDKDNDKEKDGGKPIETVAGNKRPAPQSMDNATSLKRAKYKAWVPDPSRRQQNATERRIYDALVCIGAIKGA